MSAEPLALPAIATCPAVIDNRSVRKREFRGRGFGRREVLIFECPACKAERVLRVNWRGSAPPGGFRCGAILKAEASP